MRNAGFTAFVEYAPGQTVSNTEMPVLFDDIAPRTGIHSRNVANRDETIQSMALTVADRLFAKLGIRANDCGGLVLASFSEVTARLHNQAKAVAESLGIHGDAIGTNFACSGFPASVEIALNSFPNTEKHILILTVETLSRFVDWKEQGTAILFGDRCAATTIHPSGRLKILCSWAEKLKDEKELISVEPIEGATNAWGETDTYRCLVMKGRPLYKMAPQRMYDLSLDGIRNLGMQPKDLSIICQHQANGKFAQKLNNLLMADNLLHVEVANEIGHMGNVAASSIPCALLQIEDKLKDDRIVACPAVGAGCDYERGTLSQGLVIFRATNG